jgi:hypothetical protein
MIAAAAKYFGVTDSYVFLLPLIRPILCCDLIGMEITEQALNQFLVSPLPRPVYQKTIRQWPQFLTQSSKRESITSENEEASEISRRRSASTPFGPGDLVMEEVITLLASRMTWRHPQETISKLTFMQPYIEAALKESPSRSTTWKGPALNRRNSTRRLSVQNSGVPMNMDSLLDLFSYQTLSHLPDHIVQSLIVPHQKSSLNNFATDEVRLMKRDPASLTDMAAMRSVFGVVVNQADAARVAEEGETTSAPSGTPFLGNAESAPGLYSAQSGNTTGSPAASSPALRRAGSVIAYGGTVTFAQMNDSVSSVAEVRGVLSKIKALKIPPLSPDFGCLNQPSDGRPYR